MDQLPYLERVKIQAEILLPFYRRVRAEIGEERAAALLRQSVEEFGERLGEQVAESVSGTSLEKLKALLPAFTAGDALDIEPLADTPDELSLNVRGCRYAEYFKALGEPAFGAMLTCEIDPPLTAGIGRDITLQRSQTILEGGSHCDFRWRAASD